MNSILQEKANMSVFISEAGTQAPVYSPNDSSNSMLFQSYENLLVSIKVQGERFPHPLLAFGYHWNVLVDQNQNLESSLQIFANSSGFKLLSGVANGVEIIVDLEIFDSADIEAMGDGLGLVVENQEDFPLIDLNGFTIEPGKAANIKIEPKLFTISQAALDTFNYKDRKCVGKDELVVEYFESYGLSNCLVSAALTELVENCKPLENNPTGHRFTTVSVD